MNHKVIKLNNIELGNDLPLILIAGPCQIESRDKALQAAEFLTKLCDKLNINFIYKSSFDKANRSSIEGARGIGLSKALNIFQEIKQTFGCPLLTDVHTQEQCKEVAYVIDVIQIPAFLCRQTDLLIAAAQTGKIVNVKKGQFLAPWDMANVVQKLESAGNNNILLTERGTTFGYNRLVNDMRAIPIMKELGYPVIFDATHSVQEPSGLGAASGGQRKFVKTVATAAVSLAIAGLFVETHEDPDNAPSDGPCMLPFAELEEFLIHMKRFDSLAKSSI